MTQPAHNSITQARQNFRQEFAMFEYVRCISKQFHGMCGYIVEIYLDAWGNNWYAVHWDEMPDGCIASDPLNPDDLIPVKV